MATSTYQSPTHAAISAYNLNPDKLDNTALDALVKANNGKEITPEMIPDSIRNIYINQANDQLHPWFQNETNYGQAKLNNATGQNESNYQNTIDQLNQGLKTDTIKLGANEASQGTWASGARAERANSLASQYNDKYNGAYNQASGNAANTLTANEYNYGNTGNQPNIAKYQTNPLGQVSQTGQIAKYNPFGGQGTLNVGAGMEANNLANNYIGARIKNPNPATQVRLTKQTQAIY